MTPASTLVSPALLLAFAACCLVVAFVIPLVLPSVVPFAATFSFVLAVVFSAAVCPVVTVIMRSFSASASASAPASVSVFVVVVVVMVMVVVVTVIMVATVTATATVTVTVPAFVVSSMSSSPAVRMVTAMTPTLHRHVVHALAVRIPSGSRNHRKHAVRSSQSLHVRSYTLLSDPYLGGRDRIVGRVRNSMVAASKAGLDKTAEAVSLPTCPPSPLPASSTRCP